MKLLSRITLAVAITSLSIASVASAQQTDPRDVVPPNPQKPHVSGTLTVVAPSNVQPPSENPVSVAPIAPAAPAQSKPAVPQPAAVEANTVPASNSQSLTLTSVQSSPWDKSNATPVSAWETTNATVNALAPATKTSSDPWKSSSSPSQNWNSTSQLGSSGTKTEWK